MADPRKVPFVTLATFNTTPGTESKKRRREEDTESSHHHGKDGGVGSNGKSEEPKVTVRLNLSLSEPNEQGSSEFNYSELIHSLKNVPVGLTPALDPNDPFADDVKERLEVEALARKFESKYGNAGKKKRKDRVQDLIDIGYGYDETDPFIDNSEAYDELVPASLTTKLGGFYINTGTLQFRAASDSEGEEDRKDGSQFKKQKDGEERAIKRRRKKQDGSGLEEKKPKKIRVPKQGVSALNRPEKKKRKKLMKDSLSLAAMLRRFTREKEEIKKKNLSAGMKVARPHGNVGVPPGNKALLNSHPSTAGNDMSMADLTPDHMVMSLLGSANESDMLQDLMGDLDFGMLDSPQPGSPGQGENGSLSGQKSGPVRAIRTGLICPPPLPSGLPEPLTKRIEDLRAASRQFDEEGRKKFFTLDMNNILLDIELQVQEQPQLIRSAVYSHMEAFVPCNKEALLKRMKKLSLNIQDDRLRTPLLKLKLAVCNVMPEQIARYNMDCLAKNAKQQSEEGEKNVSDEEDEEKPGKRVMGPRKKFIWDDKLRNLLCNLVKVKLGCYELEGQNSLSPEDYLKAFMETEVKPLWPKGWMQARMLFKESRMVHSHLTGNTAKKKIVSTPKPKPKPQDAGWVQRPAPSIEATPSPSLAQVVRKPPPSPSEPICLSDSLDEDLGAPSLDSISHALALLSSAAKGLVQADSPSSPEGPKPAAAGSQHASPILPQKGSTTTPGSASTSPYVPTSSHSRAPSASTSLVSTPRSEGPGVIKGGNPISQTQRQSLMGVQRTSVAAGNKLSLPGSPSPPKPRPPPTASPLLPPQKGFGSPGIKAVSTPSGPHKSSNNTRTSTAESSSPATQSRTHVLASPSLLNAKNPQTLHLSQSSQSKTMTHDSPAASPSVSQPKPHAQAHPHQQSNFITPMHATLTKSPHSSSSAILKLTPRTPGPTPPSHQRTSTLPSMQQHSSKSPAFHPPFSGVGAGYSPSSQVNTSLTSTSSISKHPPASASTASGSANHTQRQRPAGGSSQVVKPMVSVSTAPASSQLAQVSSASSSLLSSASPSLSLGFGMLGGLVPFQFPSLLNLPAASGTITGASTSAASSSTGFSLPQNVYKGLVSGPQAALPPHLQLAFSDVNQSQGGDLKRKSL
ncbi:ubinuclein-2b [Chanos chanos]|uniref:Ubinuclein-2b n=1 Tax=Chanos chanos TaxID=29144 RepID=A0A6J2WP36_CHACN|nr:ubinuclein-2-like [Chanos chanos]